MHMHTQSYTSLSFVLGPPQGPRAWRCTLTELATSAQRAPTPAQSTDGGAWLQRAQFC